jgi:GntR family transcriptional regulator
LGCRAALQTSRYVPAFGRLAEMSKTQSSRPKGRSVAADRTSPPAGALIRDGRPAGEVIEEHLRDLIAKGDFDRHARLPPERELAERLGVSRMTLRQALAALERDGLVTRSAGRNGGTFIAQGTVERNLSRFTSVPAYLRSQGFDAGSRVISASVEAADAETAEALEIAPQTPVYHLVRVRLADGVPISLEHTRLRADVLPGLLECPLGDSISDILGSRYGRVLVRAVERIEAVLADADEADALGIRRGAPLMSVHRVTYDGDGVALEFSHDLFRGDRTRTVAWTHDDLPSG